MSQLFLMGHVLLTGAQLVSDRQKGNVVLLNRAAQSDVIRNISSKLAVRCDAGKIMHLTCHQCNSLHIQDRLEGHSEPVLFMALTRIKAQKNNRCACILKPERPRLASLKDDRVDDLVIVLGEHGTARVE